MVGGVRVAGLTGTILLTIGLQVGSTERLIFCPLPTWMAVTGPVNVFEPLRNAFPRWIPTPWGSVTCGYRRTGGPR
ncbi:hypothetical protein JMUB6875_03250 [Nocardia sp. JMUB6875]